MKYKFLLLMLVFMSCKAHGQKKDSTKTLQDKLGVALDFHIDTTPISNMVLYSATPTCDTGHFNLNNTLLIVVQNSKDIIRVDGNGDLYFNPRLLMKQDYFKDTLVLWGNIYTRWTDASRASRDTMVIYHY
jgi:hypothetical protein